MKRSFYYMYYITQAGGAYTEFDVTTAKLKNLKRYIEYIIIDREKKDCCYMLLGYGVGLYLTVVENGEIIKKIDILEYVDIEIEGWGNGMFSYNPDSELFESEWDSEEQAKFEDLFIEELLLSSDSKISEKACQKIKININWEQMVIPELKENLLQEKEEIIDEDISYENPIRLGSVWLNLREEDMV